MIFLSKSLVFYFLIRGLYHFFKLVPNFLYLINGIIIDIIIDIVNITVIITTNTLLFSFICSPLFTFTYNIIIIICYPFTSNIFSIASTLMAFTSINKCKKIFNLDYIFKTIMQIIKGKNVYLLLILYNIYHR